MKISMSNEYTPHSVVKNSKSAQLLEAIKDGGKTAKELETMFPGGPNSIPSNVSNLRAKGYHIQLIDGKYQLDDEIEYRDAVGTRSYKKKDKGGVGMEMMNSRLMALSRLLQIRIKQNPIFIADAVSQIDNLIINLLVK